MLFFMRKILLISLLLATGIAGASSIYQWTDESGRTVFGDKPPPGVEATPVRVQSIQTFPAPDTSTFKSSKTEEEEKKAAEEAARPKYKVAIASPADDEPVRSNPGNIAILISSDPTLDTAAGHKFQLLMDGNPVMTSQKTSVVLTNVDRGTHTLQVQVIDETGKVLESSQNSTFHMLRFAGG
jgi:hypothetical protein